MRQLAREQADVLWGKWWDGMHVEWFKVEVLQDYTGEDKGPSLNNWMDGNRRRSIELMEADPSPVFTKMCQDKLKQGVKLLRVHIVDTPYTPYLEWEIELYKRLSIPRRGEKVHLLNRSDAKDMDIPTGDLMIFDKKRAIVNTYNWHGLMTHETFYDESDDITKFLELRKKLIELARPI